jgi:two-component system nitrate/nitrite response regulator NarL
MPHKKPSDISSEKTSKAEPVIRVAVADDYGITLSGICMYLKYASNIEVVATASNGKDLVDVALYHLPDVVLSDIRMPEMTGIEAVRMIKRAVPSMKAIMLTSFEDRDHIEEAMHAGADGYLSKDLNPKDLVQAVQQVFRREKVFSPTILQLLTTFDKDHFTPTVSESPVVLSARELEILSYIAEGKISKEIADILSLSPRTVETHRQNIMRKTGCRNATALVRFAIDHGVRYPSDSGSISYK